MVPRRYVILKISTTFLVFGGSSNLQDCYSPDIRKDSSLPLNTGGHALTLAFFFCSFRNSWQGSCQVPLLGWDFLYWSVTYCSLKMGDIGLWRGGNAQVFSFVLIKFRLWMYDTLALGFFFIFLAFWISCHIHVLICHRKVLFQVTWFSFCLTNSNSLVWGDTGSLSRKVSTVPNATVCKLNGNG